MRNLLVIICLTLIVNYGMAQKRYWFFPPNYVDMSTGQVYPLPNTNIAGQTYTNFLDLVNGSSSTISGVPLNKATDNTNIGYNYRASNGIINSNGSLGFYLNNGAIVFPGKTVYYTGTYYDDLPIIPVPGKCNSYFLIQKAVNNVLYYKEFTSDGSIFIDRTTSAPPGYSIGFRIAAVSPMRFNVSTNSPEAKLYLENLEYTVTQSGIFYSRLVIPYVGSAIGSEEEISPNGKYLATRYYSSVSILEITTNYQRIFEFPRNIVLPGIMGIEFSPNSERIFFSFGNSGSVPDQSINKIGSFAITDDRYKQLSLSDFTFIPGTGSLSGSFLETAIDGYMYVSDGSYLRGFDPNSANPTISKSIQVTNPLTLNVPANLNHFNNYYTLNDQIDGLNYANLFKAITCPSPIVYSNVSSGGGTLPLVSVASTITGSSNTIISPSTTVSFKASEEIVLSPGFVANNGSIFNAIIEPCSTGTYIDYCGGAGNVGGRIAQPILEETKSPTKEDLSIFPNPSSGIFTINLGNDLKSGNVKVYDQLGKPVREMVIENASKVDIDLSDLANDMYIVKIDLGNELIIRKIIVSK
jgi:Secretion system C-terminal sorting domain